MYIYTLCTGRHTNPGINLLKLTVSLLECNNFLGGPQVWPHKARSSLFSFLHCVWFCGSLKLVWVHLMKIGIWHNASRSGAFCCRRWGALYLMSSHTYVCSWEEHQKLLSKTTRGRTKWQTVLRLYTLCWLSVLQTLQTLYVMFKTKVFCSVDSSGVPHFRP